MADDLPPVTRTFRERRGLVTVVVNLTLPPWPVPTAPVEVANPPVPDPVLPTLAPSIPPAPVAEPDPDPAATAPTGSCPPVKKSWVNRSLGVVWLELADDAKWFFKKVRFWLFAVVASAPDLYNAAVDNHLIGGGHVPAPLEKFFNIIGFIGVAGVLVKARKKLQDDS